MPPPPSSIEWHTQMNKSEKTHLKKIEEKKQFPRIPPSFLSAVPSGANTIHYVSYS